MDINKVSQKKAAVQIRRDFHHHRCINARSSVSPCGVCQDICPEQAITFVDSEPQLSANCLGCGLCIAACPQDAFGDLFRIAGQASPEILYCSGLWPEGVKGQPSLPSSVIPCAGSITLPTLIKRMIDDRPATRIMVGDCESCTFQAGRALFDQNWLQLSSMADSLDLPLPIIEIIPASESDKAVVGDMHVEFANRLKEEQAVSRRQFFSGFRKVIQPQQSIQPGENPDAPPMELDRASRRELLRPYVLAHAHKAPLEPLSDSFHRVEVQQNCRLCGICARMCPTDTLILEQAADRVVLWAEQLLCSGCGLCADACPDSAIRISSGLTAREAAAGPVEMKSIPLRQCASCKRKFMSETQTNICPACEKSARVMADASRMIWGESTL